MCKVSNSVRLVLFGLGIVLAMTVFGVDASAQTKSKKKTVRPATVKQTSIPRGTQMKIRLENAIDTKESKDGDRFTAIVLTPSQYADATIEGHVSRIEKSGKLKGKTELLLAFDRIRLRNGENIAFDAQVVEVIGEKSAKNVDEEGNIESGSKGKTTAIRTGGGAAIGAAVGAIAGGGKGAAIGAIVGGAAGAGSTYIQGSNKVKLDAGTELVIKSTR
ncbi:MAG: hypothetical protein JNK38_29160 [Acidobacteria bacterium]|nr:hypothetical protein [Acidobacteriota bacterium]MBL8192115.1 hypothetical protein [Acidobacteriota bacterium]